MMKEVTRTEEDHRGETLELTNHGAAWIMWIVKSQIELLNYPFIFAMGEKALTGPGEVF